MNITYSLEHFPALSNLSLRSVAFEPPHASSNLQLVSWTNDSDRLAVVMAMGNGAIDALTNSSSSIEGHSNPQGLASAWNWTVTATVVVWLGEVGGGCAADLVFSAQIVPRVPPTTPSLSPGVQSAATATMSVGVASAAVAGPGAASDIQAAVVFTLARCSPTHTRLASHADEPGGFKLVTPFALNDTAAGGLGGNAAAILAMLLLQGAAVLFRCLARREALCAACSGARFPGLLLMAAAALHHSTLFCALRLLSSDSSDGLIAAGGIALLFCVAAPVLAVIAVKTAPRRFVLYVYPGADIPCETTAAAQGEKGQSTISPCYSGWLWRLARPTGLTEPAPMRRMASSIVTGYRVPDIFYGAMPFVSSFVTNLVAVLPATTSAALCSGAMFFAALVHLCLGLWILRAAPFRVPIVNVLHPLGLALTAAFQGQIAAGFRTGLQITLSLQLALSILRSIIAALLFAAEIRVQRDSSVGRSQKPLWIVGGGGDGHVGDDTEGGAVLKLVAPSLAAGPRCDTESEATIDFRGSVAVPDGSPSSASDALPRSDDDDPLELLPSASEASADGRRPPRDCPPDEVGPEHLDKSCERSSWLPSAMLAEDTVPPRTNPFDDGRRLMRYL
jgi:hypothetical protein